MLKLILRQLGRYKWPLLFLAAVWTAGAFIIFPGRYEILSWLYRFTLGRPEPGLQNPAKAWKTHVSVALEKVASVDLRRMTMACPESTIQYYRIDEEFFRPDWLQLQLLKKNPEDQVQPADAYWQQNRLLALGALRHLIEATIFAYEIPADMTDGHGAIIVPDWIERVSGALCNPYPGLMAWGNYTRFQEERAYRVLREAEKDLEDRLPFPAEREMMVLGTLRHRGEYITALQKYGGGSIPADPHAPCRDFRLVCFSPVEAASVLDRLIYVSPDDRLGSLYLNQARVYRRIQAEKKGLAPGDTKAERELERILDRYAGATRDHASEIPARLEMGDALASAERYEEAYRQLSSLATLLGSETRRHRAFRMLARRVLMGTGHYAEADCFADEALRGGLRPHCEAFRL